MKLFKLGKLTTKYPAPRVKGRRNSMIKVNGILEAIMENYSNLGCTCCTSSWIGFSNVLVHLTPWQLYRIEEILGIRLFKVFETGEDCMSEGIFSEDRGGRGGIIASEGYVESTILERISPAQIFQAIEQVLQEPRFDEEHYLEIVKTHQLFKVYIEKKKEKEEEK